MTFNCISRAEVAELQKFAMKRSLFQALCQEFFTVICNRKSVFWKYFLSNIIIVSCVIVLLIPALFYTYSNEIQKRVNDYQKVCHSFLTDWNQQLDLMSSTLQNIQNSKGFSRLKLINGELKLEDYTYLSSANDNLLFFSGFQKNIIDIFVIFRNSNILISNQAHDGWKQSTAHNAHHNKGRSLLCFGTQVL